MLAALAYNSCSRRLRWQCSLLQFVHRILKLPHLSIQFFLFGKHLDLYFSLKVGSLRSLDLYAFLQCIQSRLLLPVGSFRSSFLRR